MEIDIQIEAVFTDSVTDSMVKKALLTTFQLFNPAVLKSQTDTISIIITGNETVRRLNHLYRGVDAPTDVLSFKNELDADSNFPTDSTAFHLGDVIIAYPIAEMQAVANGHSLQAEVSLLVVHGLLHLLSFEHNTTESKKKMWVAQRQVMAKLGLAHVQPTES